MGYTRVRGKNCPNSHGLLEQVVVPSPVPEAEASSVAAPQAVLSLRMTDQPENWSSQGDVLSSASGGLGVHECSRTGDT